MELRFISAALETNQNRSGVRHDFYYESGRQLEHLHGGLVVASILCRASAWLPLLVLHPFYREIFQILIPIAHFPIRPFQLLRPLSRYLISVVQNEGPHDSYPGEELAEYVVPAAVIPAGPKAFVDLVRVVYQMPSGVEHAEMKRNILQFFCFKVAASVLSTLDSNSSLCCPLSHQSVKGRGFCGHLL